MVFTHQNHQPRILIVDDEASLRTILSTVLRREGFLVATAQDAAEALSLLKASESIEHGEHFDIVISDIKMPGQDGLYLLERITKDYEDLPVIMLTAHGSIDTAVFALKTGAFDFLLKPFERDEILMVIRKAMGQRKANTHITRVSKDVTGKTALIGQCAHIRHVHEIIQKIADTPSTVLITGESGTGKELVAQALHQNSSRHDKPFIRINCAAIPHNLIESELFGYERGAFTGAVTSKPGRFELADEGTLFLDEIGELPVEMQVKLLRVLQESSFERVGGIKTIKINVRLIAATNKNLVQAISSGEFREDLFYRLNVVPIVLGPLRERTQDIPLLVEHFVKKLNSRLQRHVLGFSPQAIEILKLHAWPGNIRELENIVERTILFADGNWIEPADLPPDIFAHIQQTPKAEHPPIGLPYPLTLNTSMKDVVRRATAEIERELIVRALDETQGNVTHAARKLKISRKSLQMKMKEFGLREEHEIIASSPL